MSLRGLKLILQQKKVSASFGKKQIKGKKDRGKHPFDKRLYFSIDGLIRDAKTKSEILLQQEDNDRCSKINHSK